MRNLRAVLLGLYCLPAFAQPLPVDLDQETAAWMQAALSRWERSCKRHLRVDPEPLPWIIFFDQRRAWHLNPDRKYLPSHSESKQSLRFARRKYPLVLVEHRDERLWTPANERLPLAAKAFAAVYGDDKKPYAVVPLPFLFRKLADDTEAPALDEFFLGLALHEFAHTRQLTQIARRLQVLRTKSGFTDSIDDNLIQTTFSTNPEYRKLYEEERGHLSRAVLADDPVLCRQAVADALRVSSERRKQYFADKQHLAELEDIFLALEGIGMWIHFKSALDSAPRGQDWRQILYRLAERTDSWSQEEGLALFLLLDRLVPNWQARFFSPDIPEPFDVLRAALQTGEQP